MRHPSSIDHLGRNANLRSASLRKDTKVPLLLISVASRRLHRNGQECAAHPKRNGRVRLFSHTISLSNAPCQFGDFEYNDSSPILTNQISQGRTCRFRAATAALWTKRCTDGPVATRDGRSIYHYSLANSEDIQWAWLPPVLSTVVGAMPGSASVRSKQFYRSK